MAKTIDPKRAEGQVSVLAQDEPGGPFRLTRHETHADAASRPRAAGGISVYESDEGQIVNTPTGTTAAEAQRLIDAQ